MDGHTPTHPPINQQHFSRSPPKVFWIIISCSARYPVLFFTFQSIIFKHFFLSLLFPPRCEPVLDSHHQSHPPIHPSSLRCRVANFLFLSLFPCSSQSFHVILDSKRYPDSKTENRKQKTRTTPALLCRPPFIFFAQMNTSPVRQPEVIPACLPCMRICYIYKCERVCVCVCVNSSSIYMM